MLNVNPCGGGMFKVSAICEGDFRQIASLQSEVLEKPYELKIEPVKKERSLDANAYAWVLIDKLAEKLRIPKAEVYREAIREIGGVSTILCMQNKVVEHFCTDWSKRGLGWFTETEPSTLKDCTKVTAYYGSSVYDTRQMATLIDRLIEEAKAQGIETMTPEELERLKGYV